MAQCTAKSKRSKEQCLKWAVRGRSTCSMHGGTSRGPATRCGKERSRLAVTKHGKYTEKAQLVRREIMAMVRECKNVLNLLA